MAFGPKPWKDKPDGTTPISAAAMIDLETRLSNYSDLVGPAANVRLAADQSIPNGVTMPVSWGVVAYDTDGMWSAAKPARLTVSRAGLYLVTGNLRYATGTGPRMARLYRNEVGVASQFWSTNASTASEVLVTAHVSCVAGDYFHLSAFQQSGAALNIGDAGTGPCFLAAVWLGAMP